MKKNNKILKLNGGYIYHGDSYVLIKSPTFLRKYEKKIDLIITSPPFALNSQKSYGNHKGNNKLMHQMKRATNI